MLVKKRLTPDELRDIRRQVEKHNPLPEDKRQQYIIDFEIILFVICIIVFILSSI